MTRATPKRLGRTVPFEGRVFRVEQDRVRLPNGRDATLDIVRHRGSVVLIPQPSRREIILVRQYRYAIGRWIWELPAGTLDPGEGARTAEDARRYFQSYANAIDMIAKVNKGRSLPEADGILEKFE